MNHSKAWRPSCLLYWNMCNKIKNSLLYKKRANSKIWFKIYDAKSIILYEKDIEYFKGFKRVLKGIFIILCKHRTIIYVTNVNEHIKNQTLVSNLHMKNKTVLIYGISEILNEFWPRWEKWVLWYAVQGQKSWMTEKIHSFLFISDFVFLRQGLTM